ncbi:PASTA domain-containing protein [Kineosporia rhizophila]|uniref:Stk1 family PASTA domain-containing Ser/Thr kinase n=1 Tax=Kineosporia TaxID=49184 RepID=UPI001E4EC795|nr:MULTISPECIES: PASTA domain-containing protein [Kineosporia]MCE0538335.1 PASTA domain-containing protein [Kineosporia rhizophila]GLY18608.1 serine/threonine protein kinase [Kineosporia sp. NBRC 101677]
MTLQDPLVGRLVDGRYLVRSRIARGGMATVYLAVDRRLDREVALKVMHENLADDPEFVSRFVHEARSAAKLSHPNVVGVFDQGTDETSGVLYLAMEYLPGRTLRDVLSQRGALTPRESVSVLEPVLSALGAAHRAGFVHRDVKPENVILTDDGRIKVADFGLAAAVTAPIASAATDELLGTVAYLSPELVANGHADARADVYAAGIILFELLTGRQPYTGDDPIQVAYRHVYERVPTPSSIAPNLTDGFDQLVLRLTDPNPDRRPATCDAALSELRAARAAVPPHLLDERAADADDLRSAQTVAMGDSTQEFGAVPPSAAVNATAVYSRSDRPDLSPAGPTRIVTPSSAGLALSQQNADDQATALYQPAVDDQATALYQPAPGPAPATGPQPTRTMSRREGRLASKETMVPRLRVHDEDEAPPGFFGNRRRAAITTGLGIVVVLALVFTGIWWFTGGPGSYVRTPAVTAMRVADAQRVVVLQGLQAEVREEFSDSVAEGTVIGSSPAGGEDVKKDGTVTLIVSKGREMVAVPNVKGKTLEEATAELEGVGLAVGDTSEKFSADVEKGKVISSTPKAENEVTPGREIKLVISKGIEPVALDNVVGQHIDQAKPLLESRGLKVEIVNQPFQAGGAAPGTVTAMDPAATGQQVPKGSTVKLTVVEQPPQVAVPNVQGQDFEQAKATLEGLGLRVKEEKYNPFSNTVQEQTPNSGNVDVGTEIVLKIW